MKHSKKALPLTIVIPAYNEERNIRSCLDAIAHQTTKPDAVLVVDNNSTDRTVAIASQYPFVTVVSESKQGIAYARNRGFDAVNDGIIARIDADTTLPVDWVEQVRNFYSNDKSSGYALTGTGYFTNVLFPPRVVSTFFQTLIAFRFNRLIMGHYILWGSNMAMLADQWRLVRNDVCNDTDIHEDLDLAIHLTKSGIKIKFDKTLIVGVVMRRVLDNWTSLYANLLWWPRTLRKHNNKRWILGLMGAYFLLIMSSVVILFNKPVLAVRRLQRSQLYTRLAKIFD